MTATVFLTSVSKLQPGDVFLSGLTTEGGPFGPYTYVDAWTVPTDNVLHVLTLEYAHDMHFWSGRTVEIVGWTPVHPGHRRPLPSSYARGSLPWSYRC